MCKSSCIFYSIYRDHGASVPFCSRDNLDLCSAISFLEKNCPCNCFITVDIIRDLQESGDIYIDYRRFLNIQPQIIEAAGSTSACAIFLPFFSLSNKKSAAYAAGAGAGPLPRRHGNIKAAGLNLLLFIC